MGTTTLAVCGAMLYPVADLVLEWRKGGRSAVNQHWKERLGVSLVIAVCWWSILFLYHLVWTVPQNIYREAGIHATELTKIRTRVPLGSIKPVSPRALAVKRSFPLILFSKDLSGSWVMTAFNEGHEPIDDVGVSIMRIHAGPEYKADQALLIQDMKGETAINVGTLRADLATRIGMTPPHLLPYLDKPSEYQLTIFTRYETFTESLYMSPKGDFVDQGADVSSNKTHEWFIKQQETVMKRWKNWPKWWR